MRQKPKTDNQVPPIIHFSCVRAIAQQREMVFGLPAKRSYREGMAPGKYFDEVLSQKLQETFELIEIDNKQAKGMFNLFVKIDTDASGNISLSEFYNHFGIKRTKFSDRLFGYFDLDKSEELNFQEFMVGIWNVCTFNETRMSKFGLDLFDAQGKGTLDKYEVDALVRMVHDIEEVPDELKARIDGMDVDGNGQVSLRELSRYSRELLAPAYEIQNMLRNVVLRPGFWVERTEKRTSDFGELARAEDILLRKRKQQLEAEREKQRAKSKRYHKVSPQQEEMEKHEDYDDETEKQKHERIVRIRLRRAIEEFESCDEDDLSAKAHAKQHIQDSVHELIEAAHDALVESEQHAYRQAIVETERSAEQFFNDRQGERYIRTVGKEHALRKHMPVFGLLSKKQRVEGENKARSEYLSKKTKQATEKVNHEFRTKEDATEAEIASLIKTYDLLTPSEQDLIGLQWQELYDENTMHNYYYCPALDGALWIAPNIENAEGLCQDRTCHENAKLRCPSCAMEFCIDCDRIAHSVGPSKNHRGRAEISALELEWRDMIRKHLKTHRQLLTKTFCSDPIELLRRNMEQS